MFILVISNVNAWLKQRNFFYDDSSTPHAVTNVVAIGYACTKADCSTVDTSKRLYYYDGSSVKTIPVYGVSSGTKTYIDIVYPDNLMTTH